MKKVLKKFSPIFLLAFLALVVLIPTQDASAATITVPSAYGNCDPYSVTFNTDQPIYQLGDSIYMLGTVVQDNTDDCFINSMNMGGATSQMNAGNNTLIFVFQTSTVPPSPYSGGPTFFGQAQGEGSQPLYFRFNMWEMCEVGGSCGTVGGNTTSIGQYTYTTGSTSYCVGANCGSGGGGGGGYANLSVSISANPNPVSSPGAISNVHWDSNNASSCTVTSSLDGLISEELTGYYGADIPSTTTFTIHCYGLIAQKSPIKKFVYSGNILKDVKNYISLLIPKVIADNTPGVPEATDSVVVTIAPQILEVEIEKDPARVKDLVRKGSISSSGTSYFRSIISNMPSGTTCYLQKNGVNVTSCTGCPSYPYQSSGSYLSLLSNFDQNSNVINLSCTDSNNTQSNDEDVLAQSGTLPPPGASCQIPLNQSTCSIPLTFTTVNPNPGSPTVIKNSAGATLLTDNDGNGTNVSVSFGYGADQTITSYNVVDGENNGPSVENTLATTTVTALCASGVWDGSKCAPAPTIDLIASNTTPNTAQVNVAKTFNATITNQGTLSTGKTFYNIFQTATGFNDDYTPIGLQTYGANPSPMGILAASATNTASRSFTFTTPGIIYMRACADLNTSMVGGVTEGFENNNCSPNWTPVTVSGGADITASATWPTSAPAGVATTYSSTITNQGSVSTGATFINLFQTATGFDDPTNQVGPINLVDYVANPNPMSALAAGSSNTATRSITFSAGNYFMRACADKSSASNTGTITEPGAEGNNCSAWSPLSIPPQVQPDLVAGAPTPTVAVVNVATTFSSRITNQGTAGTGGSFGNLFQVTTNPVGGTITDYPTVLSMSPLAGNGGSSNATRSITFSSTGTYYMRACADKTSSSSVGVIAESNETNNCSLWTPITVSAGGLPDLTAGGITPTSVMVDVATTFQVTVANIGVASTVTSFYNLIQLSPNSPGASPIVEQRISTTALSAQSSRTLSFIYTFRDPGTYYARVCADKSSGGDNTGTISESNESNNCGVWTMITVPSDAKPDLVASTTTPTVVVINMPNTFSSIIRNQGTVSTGSKVNNLFQVSTSSTGASDVTDYPADVNPPALDAGESATTVSPSITFDKEMPFYMRACADKTSAIDSGTITESNEGNNCSAWTLITVQPEGMPIDGGWTEWNWGACSVSCGGGTQTGTRTCTNPVPQNGGASCVGPTTTEQTCNTQACPTECANGAVDYPDCKECPDGSLPDSHPGGICPGGSGSGELMVTLTASPTMIFKGRSSTLTWNSTADSCTSAQFVTNDNPTGTVLVSPTDTTTYNISCRGASGEGTASATIKVINPIIIEN